VTIVAYPLSLVLGLVIALGRISRNIIIYQISTFYVEIVRGLPMLVLLIYVAFGLTPIVSNFINSLGMRMTEAHILPDIASGLVALKTRDISAESRGTVALVIAYAAFLSEIFRAGIESIDRGQIEAARALGMTYWQTMQYVVLRQAIRQVLPPLGNDFIAMLKDSSLVSVIGALDITQRGGVYATNSFRPIEAYNVMAYLYLIMTLLLSMVVKWIERQMARERRV
jgi:His/Glu/Gln/Arg/opine family amino acid ABC transporter permease subunit